MADRLSHRTSSRQMGSGNMKRALARIMLELSALVDEAPPVGDWHDQEAVVIKDDLAEIAKRITGLW